MDRSFKKITSIVFIISLSILGLVEWSINKEIKTEHIIGWIFVALFIGSLAGILFKKDKLH